MYSKLYLRSIFGGGGVEKIKKIESLGKEKRE